MPNHFHFLDYIRTDEEQRGWLLTQGEEGCRLSESWQLMLEPKTAM